MVPVKEPMLTHVIDETRVFVHFYAPEGITRRWTLKLHGELRPRPYDVQFEFGLIVAGRAKVCRIRTVTIMLISLISRTYVHVALCRRQAYH